MKVAVVTVMIVAIPIAASRMEMGHLRLMISISMHPYPLAQ